MTIEEHKEFAVESSSLKEIRSFAREVLAKDPIFQNSKDDVVLALAEAAQNIVKHAYKDNPDTNDKMAVQISCKENKLEIGFFDMGNAVDPKKIKHRNIDNIRPGGLGTFFIQEIMDAMEFKEGKQSWVNHLVLTKQL